MHNEYAHTLYNIIRNKVIRASGKPLHFIFVRIIAYKHISHDVLTSTTKLTKLSTGTPSSSIQHTRNIHTNNDGPFFLWSSLSCTSFGGSVDGEVGP